MYHQPKCVYLLIDFYFSFFFSFQASSFVTVTTIHDKSLGTNVHLWLFTNTRNKESGDIQHTRAQPLPPTPPTMLKTRIRNLF